MNKPPTPSAPPAAAKPRPDAGQARKDRLAKALRQNLQRRKSAAPRT